MCRSSNDAFPFGTWREIEIGYAVARAHRISYVGELGWELYVPADMARHVFEALDGARRRGRPAGSAARTRSTAAASRRPTATSATTSPRPTMCWKPASALPSSSTRPGAASAISSAATRCCGREQAGLSRRLVQFLLADPRPLLYRNEAIVRDGRIAGYLTSGAYGHHLGAAVGLGYVACDPGERAAELLGSSYEIEVAGEQVPARASLEPLYDPKGARLRASPSPHRGEDVRP